MMDDSHSLKDNSEERQSEPEDTVSINALSDEDLAHIANNLKYQGYATRHSIPNSGGCRISEKGARHIRTQSTCANFFLVRPQTCKPCP